MKKPSILLLDVKPGDVVSIDEGRIRLEVLEKSGKLARLRVQAPREVSVKLHKPED